LTLPDDNTKSKNEEKLQEVMVGELKPYNAQITLLDYNPQWSKLFDREAKGIYPILGKKVPQLGHVGSTSVPSLCAKPIIDILLVVKNSADESAYVPDLEGAGYTLHIREPDWFQHRLLKGPDTNINLHVFSEGSSEIDRMLRFRN